MSKKKKRELLIKNYDLRRERWCPECGRKVYLPCVACQVRQVLARQGAGGRGQGAGNSGSRPSTLDSRPSTNSRLMEV